MNYAVIGTGYWGSNHARVGAELLDEGEIDSLVFCDVDESKAAEQADQYGVEYVTSHRDLVDHDVDAATVATPSPTHQEITTDLLEAGIDCLVEKPLALTSDAAWDIVDSAERNNRTLAVGHIFRHHPALRDLKKRIDRGELGEIKYLTTNRSTFRTPRETTGVLYSLAVHDLDIYNMLLEDSPDHLYCRLDSHLRKGIDETATIVTGYGDTTGVINESWQLPVYGKRRDIVVVGSERTAYLDYLANTQIELYDARVTDTQGTLQAVDEGSTTYEVEGYEPLKQELEDFIKASEQRRDPVAPGRIGAKTIELLEVANRSSETKQAIDLS
jgi:predicted dehydrogenase